MPFPLAQHADLLPKQIWWLLIFIGLLSPIAGLLGSAVKYGFSRHRVWPVVGYYFLSLPMGAVVLVTSAENLMSVCSLLLLLPLGVLLGVGLLFRWSDGEGKHRGK